MSSNAEFLKAKINSHKACKIKVTSSLNNFIIIKKILTKNVSKFNTIETLKCYKFHLTVREQLLNNWRSCLTFHKNTCKIKTAALELHICKLGENRKNK